MDVPPFRSSIQESVWPAVPTQRGAALLAMQYQLEKTERWSAEQLLTSQQRQIQSVLRHALLTVPYYKERRAAYEAALSHSDPGGAWASVPLLGRRDIQAAGTALISEAIPEAHGKTNTLTTTGSTGTPVTVHGTQLTQFFWLSFTLRQILWHRFDLKEKYASIRISWDPHDKSPEGVTLPGWGPAISPAYVTGPSLFLSIALPVTEQLAWLHKEEPRYLLTYPSNLAALLLHCRAQGAKFPVTGKVQTFAEVVSPQLRLLCREVADLPIVDMYSSQEVGYMALQCPEHEHYHVQSETVLLEVLSADGKPCAAGETGRVVVTTLHNFAMPLIRYDIGDYATVGEPCPCGRGLPVLSRIMGRVRNMLTLPSGDKVWPYYGGDKFSKTAPIRQYQLAQIGLTELELRLVADRTLTEEEIGTLRDIINEGLGHPYAIRVTYRDGIMRGAGGKFEDFRCELPS
jgi:phenylacetate-CoA ligase